MNLNSFGPASESICSLVVYQFRHIILTINLLAQQPNIFFLPRRYQLNYFRLPIIYILLLFSCVFISFACAHARPTIVETFAYPNVIFIIDDWCSGRVSVFVVRISFQFACF